MPPIILALLVITLITGCHSFPNDQRHVVVIDKHGDPELFDRHGSQKMNAYQYERHLDLITNAIAGFATSPEKRKILLYFHGGLNNKRATFKRVNTLSEGIKEDGYYPIFLSWDTSLIKAYGDHLLHVRRGNADYGAIGYVMTPFYFIADLGSAVLKSPIVFLEGFWRTAEAIPMRMFQNSAQDGALRSKAELLQAYQKQEDTEIAVEIGENKLSPMQTVGEVSATLAYTPVRMLFSPFMHAMGTPSWNVMLRRVDLLFESELDSHLGYGTAMVPQGALSQLAQRLAGLTAGHENDWEITMIGHSMGAIVATEFLERASTYRSQFPVIKNVILMAPACTQRDFEHSVLPYMQTHTNTVCSILTLEMRAELWERNFWYGVPLPQGSLLLWIDDYFSQPNSEFDHTLGRFTNLMLSAHRIPQELRSRISIRAFPYQWNSPKGIPTRHGQFDDHKFWPPSFWEVRKFHTDSTVPSQR